MGVNTSQLPDNACAIDITTTLAAGSLTITKAVVQKYGTDLVLVLTYSDTTIGYVKWKQGRCKVGGSDNTFATGTEIIWNA